MKEDPQLDLATFAFPSDTLTIKDLRRMHPKAIDGKSVTIFKGEPVSMDVEVIFGLLQMERDLARDAFLNVLGKDQGVPEIEGYVIDLAKYYIKYGLAKGQHHAEQLIREFESRAADLARQHTGRRP